MTRDERVEALRSLMTTSGVDALLVTHVVNVRYLTGFTGSAASVLVKANSVTLATDGRYAQQAESELAAAGLAAERIIGDQDAQSNGLAARARGLRLGLEADHVSWNRQRSIANGWSGVAELVATDGLVEVLRRQKDAAEVASIERAAAIADQALMTILPMLAAGPTESEFALELDFAMRRLGATGTAFSTIVASGRNGARPHHSPGPRAITEGDLVVVDFGAEVDGYRSDMTRTICVGDVSPEATRMLDVVLRSQAAGVAALEPGATAEAVDRECRDVIETAGWAGAFLHPTGHGVGLEIHEYPILRAGVTGSLEPGFVVTVEPGVYLPETGGVRIEDTLVVTTDGNRSLTNAPKDLVIR